MTKKFNRIISESSLAKGLVGGLLCSLLVGCSEGVEPLSPQPQGGVEVHVAVPAAGSRAEIEENGAVTRWSSDDRIALWAEADGAFTLEAKPFSLWHFTDAYSTAYFTAVVDPMPERTYTYYAAYPLPEEQQGTQLTYTLPAVQKGTSRIDHTLMVAEPVEAGSLTASKEEIALSFRHKLHLIKITIPEAKNLLGKPVKRLEITFPVAVTGRLTLDLAAPDEPVTLSEGERVLNLEFDEPVDAGDVVWAVIAPVDASAGMISFRAYSEEDESELISTMGKRFEEGHTTPIRLTIPSFRKLTRLYFSVGQNNLGETIENITITAPAGVTFPDGSSMKSFAANEDNLYEYLYEGVFTDNLSGKNFTMTFESKSAIVTQPFVMPQLSLYERNTIPAVDVPYLYFEDFSTIGGYNDNGSGGRNLDSSGSAINDTFRVSGWTGNQTYGTAGKAIALRTRRETVAEYCGRLDSPALSLLKPNASVTVRVSFDYGFSSEHAATELKMHTGYTTTQGGISGDDSISNRTEITAADRSGSMDNVNHSYTAEYSGFTPQHRLSFGLYSTYDFGTNGWASYNHWLYIDNIRVSIVE